MEGYFTGRSGGISNSRITYEFFKDAASQLYQSIKENPGKVGLTLAGILGYGAADISIAAAQEFSKPQAQCQQEVDPDVRGLIELVKSNPDKTDKIEWGRLARDSFLREYEKSILIGREKFTVFYYDDGSEPDVNKRRFESADGILGVGDWVVIYPPKEFFLDVDLEGFDNGCNPYERAVVPGIQSNTKRSWKSSWPKGVRQKVQERYKLIVRKLREAMSQQSQ